MSVYVSSTWLKVADWVTVKLLNPRRYPNVVAAPAGCATIPYSWIFKHFRPNTGLVTVLRIDSAIVVYRRYSYRLQVAQRKGKSDAAEDQNGTKGVTTSKVIEST